MRLLYSLIFTLFLLMFLPVFSHAKILPDVVYAVTQSNLNTKNLHKNDRIFLNVIKTGKFSEELNLENGEEIEIKIVNYVKPKRGKRNGYYNISYKSKQNKQMTGTMRVSTPKDIKELAKMAGITATGMILHIPGFSQAIAVSKGLIMPNENQSRLKSAGENLYNSTPLKYVEVGQDFETEKNGIVVIRLKDV